MELKKGWLIGAFSDLDALRLSAVRESRLPVILSSATVGLKLRVVLLSRSIQNGAARCPRSTSQTHFCPITPKGGMNLDVALWVGRHERGAGQNELGCSAEWTLGVGPRDRSMGQRGAANRRWNSAMAE